MAQWVSNTSYYAQGDVIATARAHGYHTWTCDPAITTTSNVGSGRPYLLKVWIPRTVTINNIVTVVATAGSGLTTNSNACIFDSAGTQQAVTAELSTTLSSTGVKTIAVTTPYTVTGGPGVFVWIGLKVSGTTPPQLLRSIGSSVAGINIGLSVDVAKIATNGADNTATLMPTSITPASNSITNGLLFFMALS